MTISVSNVQLTQTFNSWLTTTNVLARIVTQNTVTVDSTAQGSLSSGNGYVNGHFGSDFLYVNSGLVGGEPGTNASILILSNTAFRSGSANLVVITANGTTTQTTVQTNTVIIAPTVSTRISGPLLNVATTSTSISSNTVALVTGTVTVSGNVAFRSNSTFNALTINSLAGVATITANTSSATFTGNVALGNLLTVVGNAAFSNSLAVVGNAAFSNSVTVANSIRVTGDANVGSLFTPGSANIAGNARISGDLIVTGDFLYSGTTVGDLLPAANNTLNLGSPSQYWAEGYLSSLDSTNIDVSNTATINTAIITNTLAVTNAATFSNTVIVAGSATFINTANFVGNVTLSSANVTTTIALGNVVLFSTNNFTFTNSNTMTTIDSFATASFKSVEYFIQTADTTAPANSRQITKLILIHDDTLAQLTEYATITTNAAMGIFNAAISAGTLNLRYTPVSNNVIVKLTRSAITV